MSVYGSTLHGFKVKCTLLSKVRWSGTWSSLFIPQPAIMSRYLKHFTAVGDQHVVHSDEEELHVSSEELSPATAQLPVTLTFRDSFKRLYSSEHFQVCRCSLFRKCTKETVVWAFQSAKATKLLQWQRNMRVGTRFQEKSIKIKKCKFGWASVRDHHLSHVWTAFKAAAVVLEI